VLLGLLLALLTHTWAIAASQPSPQPFVRPEFAQQMRELRPAILAAAQRHNRPEISGMTDAEFATVIALILYNENVGWLEDALPVLRRVAPLYQAAQVELNRAGANLSVWPTNLRPSVALEIVRQELPVPDGVIHAPVQVRGSRVAAESFADKRALYAALSAEITRPELGVEYLAANLARGLERARHEQTPVSWRTLAAWHNQGIVTPAAIAANPTASDYIRRAEAYLPLAHALFAEGGAILRDTRSEPRAGRVHKESR
jgi:hypothetical protein